MAVVLNWTNPNPPENTIKVFRSEAPINVQNISELEPIALLEGDAKSYTDTSAVGGKNYYYVVEATNGEESIFTKTPGITNLRNRGPGPATLQQGDADCGYYGEVDPLELPDLITAYEANTDIVTNATRIPAVYHKFAWKGRILFVADRHTGIHVKDRKKRLGSGLAYAFTNPELEARVLNVVSHKGFSYHARCPRQTPEDWDGVLPATHKDVVSNPDTEVNQIIASLMNYGTSFHKRKLHSIRVVKRTDAYPLYRMGVADPFSKDGNSTYSVTRFKFDGGRNDPYYQLSYDVEKQFTVAGFYYSDTSVNYYDNSGYVQVWPVFELIED